MALTKEMAYDENKINHVMGDQYIIPVTLNLKDGVTTVFSVTVFVEHKTNRTIAESINSLQVQNRFNKAVQSYLGIEEVKANIPILMNSEVRK